MPMTAECIDTGPVWLAVIVADSHVIDSSGCSDADEVEIAPLIASRGVYLATGPYFGEADDKGKVKLHGQAKEWAKQFDKNDAVVWAEPNLLYTAGDLRFHSWQFRAMPAGSTAYTSRIASIEQAAFAQMSVGDAHAQGTGQGVRVAILDTGVDASHELLAGRVVDQCDFVDDDGDASEEANGFDDDGDGFVDGAFGHGPFVAGVIAQVAPDAGLYPLRIIDDEGNAQLYAVIEAIDVAIEMDVDIINLSFGLPDFTKIDAFEDAMKRAKHAGIMVVAAAGNAGNDKPSYPASHKDVISVAASDETNVAKALFEGARKMHGKAKTERGLVDVLASLERLR